MEDKNYSRRDFLISFATLSSASMLLSLSAGCGGVYGPAPVAYGRVSGIYYTDERSNLSILTNTQIVPIHTAFTIDFSVNMKSDVLPIISFTELARNSEVICIKTWKNNTTLIVTPSTPLVLNSAYKISIVDAVDSNGNKISIDSFATITFNTVIS